MGNCILNNHGIFPEPGTVRFERILPGPVERIWDYLTKSELKAKWLSAGDVAPQVGGKVEFRFRHSELSDTDDPIPEKYKHMQDGTYFEGRVTAWEPYRLLRYTWGEETGEVSEVTYELIPRENNKVLLVLTHVRLGDDPSILISVGAGWHTHLGILINRLKGVSPEGFWSVHNRLEKEYEQIID
ncbi:MAG: SRPBCC family protein [Balneolaceae bacterium]|nr:MAG: SRPBCC family protein [Balneolaceae bacterium]